MRGASPLRIAVVGCGRMGRERAKAASLLGNALVVFHDLDAGRAHALASTYSNARVVDDVHRMPWTALDAVFLCTPPFARGEIAAAAIDAGVPLFIEKPIGVTAVSAQPLVEAIGRNGVLNAVGYMNRYRASVETAKRLLGARRVLGASAYWFAGVYRVPWREQDESSGAGINDEATHAIDLLRYLVGEIVTVHATRTCSPSEPSVASSACSVAALLQFEDGILGTLSYSNQSTVKQIGITVFTSTGPVSLDTWNFDLTCDGQRIPGSDAGADRSAIFLLEVDQFLKAVRYGDRASVRCSVLDAIRTQRVVDAVRASLTSSLPVAVS